MRFVWMVALAALVIGCGDSEVKPDSASGDDFERAGAAELFLDKLTDDYIDAKKGDNTDWKFFKIRQRGILELTVYWDNKNVGSIIDVRDRFGVLIDSRRHSSELEKDKLDLKIEPGTHFIRMYTARGASVYTMEAVFQPFDYKATDDVIPEAMEDDPLAELRDPRPRARRPRRPGTRRPRARRPAAETFKGEAVEARITRVLPGSSGGSLLYLDKGASAGLEAGQRGYILKMKKAGAFKVESVRQNYSTARTKAKPETIAHRRRVRVFK